MTHPLAVRLSGRTVINHGMPHFENMDANAVRRCWRNLMRNIGHRDQLAWKHVELIRKRWKGKLVVKGLIAPADARIARESGVDGVIVSNHGGRQLDHTVSALRTLPEIAAEAGGMTIWTARGVRRGTDVIALALGAHFPGPRPCFMRRWPAAISRRQRALRCSDEASRSRRCSASAASAKPGSCGVCIVKACAGHGARAPSPPLELAVGLRGHPVMIRCSAQPCGGADHTAYRLRMSSSR
jgi:hypothetical protein